MNRFEWYHILWAVAVLIILAPAARWAVRDRRWPMYVAIWLAIILGLALVYKLIYG